MVVARLYLARVLDRFGRQDEAADHLDEAVRIAPQWQEAVRRRDAQRLRIEGEALFASGGREMALKRLIEAMRNDPEDPILQNDLGVVLHAMRQFEASRQAFERALRLAPGMPEAVENLAALP
jgi:Flp pilus assembly protein TadD